MSIPPINTGAEFPDGAVTRDGKCTQCEQLRPVAVTWIRAPNVMPDALVKRLLCCAECVTDFAAGADVGPFFVETYVESRQADGGTRMQLVLAKVVSPSGEVPL